jgi:hypothetical protein
VKVATFRKLDLLTSKNDQIGQSGTAKEARLSQDHVSKVIRKNFGMTVRKMTDFYSRRCFMPHTSKKTLTNAATVKSKK